MLIRVQPWFRDKRLTILMDNLTGVGKTNKKRWCASWEEHPEAVHRLAAIYDVWQGALTGDVSLHGFCHDVLDYHHLPMLTDPETGVFARCARDGHQRPAVDVSPHVARSSGQREGIRQPQSYVGLHPLRIITSEFHPWLGVHDSRLYVGPPPCLLNATWQ